MESKVTKIGVLTSGGDAPGMNAAIRAVVRTGIYNGLEVFGIMRGYAGMIENDIVPMHSRSVANIIQRGGTILKTARCKEFFEHEGRKKAYANLKNLGINGSFNYPISKKISFNLNARFSNVWIKGYFNNQLYSNKGITGNMFSYMGYKITDTWRAGINAGYSTPYITLQGKSSSNVFTGISTSKDILNKKVLIINLIITFSSKSHLITTDEIFH